MKLNFLSYCLLLLFISLAHYASAEAYYVDQNHPQASDDNPGTEEEPFLTVQKGINTAEFRDTVFIKIGFYDLTGYSKNLDQPISILGEDKHATILDGIGTLNIIGSSLSDIFTMRDLRFSDYEGSIFNLIVPEGEIIDGISISNCIFDRIERTSKTRLFIARYDVSPDGEIRNINISNCDFKGITAPGMKFIYIYEGIISNISILNNNFHGMISNSDTRGSVGVYVGTNSNLAVNHDILISGNFFDTIVAGTDGEIETHAILAYGDNISIIRNTVRYMVPGTDHEAIYMKGSYSLIADNVMINCTSNQGAIAIKGSGKSFSDTIRNNRVQSNQLGRSIYTAGPENVTMEYNYVKNTCDTSHAGLYIYAANNTACFIRNNYAQTAGDAAYMHDVVDGEITNNTLISYNAETIDLNNGTTSNIYLLNNLEFTGWPPYPPVSIASADTMEGASPLHINFSGDESYDFNGDIVSWEWNFHDGTTSTEINPTHTFTEQRTYAVTLITTDADGFKDMDYILIRVYPEEVSTGIQARNIPHKDLKLNIYPNPFKSSANINFELSASSKVSIDVIDLKGTIVNSLFNGSLISGKHNMIWDGRNREGKQAASGIYFIRLIHDNQCQSRKVIINSL